MQFYRKISFFYLAYDKKTVSEMPFHRTAETAEAEGDHVHIPFQQGMFSLVVRHVIGVTDTQV